MATIIEGRFKSSGPAFVKGQLVAVMTSEWAQSWHWLRLREDGPSALSATYRALCGARPGGWIQAWSMAYEDAVTPSWHTWAYAGQVPPCKRCEEKHGSR